MSRYNGSNGGSNGGNDYEDDTTIKLQKYAALRLDPTGLNASEHDQYGTSFISNFENTEVIDGIVFQREDKENTWKVFSAGKFFNLNPEDGLVYEKFSDEDGYEGELSASDVLEHPRVVGFSETFGGQDYFYQPVGVVIEAASDIAVNDDLEVETTDEPAIQVEDSSMLLSNKSWTRTLAKKLSAGGDDIINDNGEDPTPRDEPDENPKYSDHDWLTTTDPTLRDELEGRSLELWVTEQTQTFDDSDEEKTYTVPNLMDVKTENFVNIDNGIASGDGDDAEADADTEKAAATDGGTTTESTESTTDTETTESPETPGGLPEGVPDELDQLIDYLARNGDTQPESIRAFAEDEVDDPDAIDWEAAAEVAQERAE